MCKFVCICNLKLYTFTRENLSSHILKRKIIMSVRALNQTRIVCNWSFFFSIYVFSFLQRIKN